MAGSPHKQYFNPHKQYSKLSKDNLIKDIKKEINSIDEEISSKPSAVWTDYISRLKIAKSNLYFALSNLLK